MEMSRFNLALVGVFFFVGDLALVGVFFFVSDLPVDGLVALGRFVATFFSERPCIVGVKGVN